MTQDFIFFRSLERGLCAVRGGLMMGLLVGSETVYCPWK